MGAIASALILALTLAFVPTPGAVSASAPGCVAHCAPRVVADAPAAEPTEATEPIEAPVAAPDGEQLDDLPAVPPSAEETARWWADLDADARESLIEHSPELVGNLDGVPYDVRDEINRSVLARDLEAVRTGLTAGLGKAASRNALQRLSMLQEIEESLVREPGTPSRRLVVLDTQFPGKAAVVLGDIEHADFVSILVPGALLSVREHMSEWTKVVADLYDSQEDWQATFEDDRTVATVSWIGYHTPDMTNAIGLDLAVQGGTALASFVGGIRSLREGDEPHVSVFAHSYGATATTLALARGWMSVDALAMIGSPGGEVSNVSELAVPSDKVWVGEASWDPIVNTAFFGVDPSSPSFGAKRMNVSGSADPVTGAALAASYGHDWYLEPGTESLRNLSLIGIDRGDFVTDGSDDDQLKTLALLGGEGADRSAN